MQLGTNGNQKIAPAIELDPENWRLRNIMLPKTVEIRRHRHTVLRWLTGGVAWHHNCFSCDLEVDRKHALSCSGALIHLLDHYGDIVEYIEDENLNYLDKLLNFYKFDGTPVFYRIVFEAVGLIYEHCIGFVGDWSLTQPP